MPTSPAPEVAPAAAVPRESVVVTTDVLKLTFDSEGGSIVKSEFLKHGGKGDDVTAICLA